MLKVQVNNLQQKPVYNGPMDSHVTEVLLY